MAERDLIPAGSRVLVGFSGGADSTCLLHLLAQLGFPVVGAHLDHGQRPEAPAEAEHCEAFCRELGVGFVAGRADVPALAEALGVGLEEAGREARYEFFRKAAAQQCCDLIATAHTRDDHLETIVLNLCRGTGLAGLAGIPERRDAIVRPLLPFSREETRAYCREHGLAFLEDPGNTDRRFARVRVRLDVLPALRAVHPGCDRALERLSRLAAEEDRYLNSLAAAALEQCEVPLNGPLRFLTEDLEAAFDRDRLLAFPAVPVRRALRLLGSVFGASSEEEGIADLLSALTKEECGSFTYPGGGAVLEWDARLVHVRAAREEEPFRFPLTEPGVTEAETLGWRIVAWRRDRPDEPRPASTLEAFVDRERVQGDLYFRSARHGDRIAPLGLSGTKLLSDIFREMGLTRHARRRLPIVCDLVGPVWIPGGPIAERVKIRSETRTVLALRLERFSAYDASTETARRSVG